ncbi:MAG: hypothetical protein WCP92_09275 [bacterium]
MKKLFFMMIGSIVKCIKSFEMVKTDTSKTEKKIDSFYKDNPKGQGFVRPGDRLLMREYKIIDGGPKFTPCRLDFPSKPEKGMEPKVSTDKNVKPVSIAKIKYFLRTGSLLPGKYPITLFNEEAIREFLKEHGETAEAIEETISGFFNKGYYFVPYVI